MKNKTSRTFLWKSDVLRIPAKNKKEPNKEDERDPNQLNRLLALLARHDKTSAESWTLSSASQLIDLLVTTNFFAFQWLVLRLFSSYNFIRTRRGDEQMDVVGRTSRAFNKIKTLKKKMLHIAQSWPFWPSVTSLVKWKSFRLCSPNLHKIRLS